MRISFLFTLALALILTACSSIAKDPEQEEAGREFLGRMFRGDCEAAWKMTKQGAGAQGVLPEFNAACESARKLSEAYGKEMYVARHGTKFKGGESFRHITFAFTSQKEKDDAPAFYLVFPNEEGNTQITGFEHKTKNQVSE